MPAIAPERTQAFDRHRESRGPGAAATVGFSVLLVLFAAYVVLALVPNPGGGWREFVNRWPLAGFEIIASGLCITRAIADREDRWVAVILGSGLLAWSLGDAVLDLGDPRQWQSADAVMGRSLPSRVLPARLYGS